MVLFDRFIEMV